MLRWYSKGAFIRQLEKLECNEDTCTEAQCMMALHAVSRALRQEEKLSKVPYAGPQCFAQLESRLDNNLIKEPKGKGNKQVQLYSDPVAREQLKQCWMRCQSCSKRRLVERTSLPALREEDYRKVFPGTDPGYWESWIEQADVRYEEYVLDQISFN